MMEAPHIGLDVCFQSNSAGARQLGDEERESIKSAWVKQVVGKRLKQHKELFWNQIEFSQTES